MDLSIMIVGYNSAGYIGACLDGVFSHTHGISFEVLFVNCSTDATEELLKREYPQVKVIDNNSNLGFSRGNNLLASRARGRRLLLLNPDTQVEDDAITRLFMFAQDNPTAGAWGGMTVFPNGNIDDDCQHARLGLANTIMTMIGAARFRKGILSVNATEPQSVPVLSGAFMMIDRSTWEDLGGFDEDYFLYTEEVDLCYRLEKNDKTLLINPQIRIVHDAGSGRKRSPERFLARARGNAHFFRKHFSASHMALCLIAMWVHAFSRLTLSLIPGTMSREKAGQFRSSYGQLVLHPVSWMRGYGRTTAN